MFATDPMAFQALEPARLRPDSRLVSARYGDVYHSAEGALAQAEHVFVRGSGLPQRWQGRSRFIIGETGFGLGLNFLALWQAWRADPGRCARLHVVSVEAHPMSRRELTHWHGVLLPASWLARASDLQAQWPVLTPGLHRLEFDGGAVTLTLALGEAEAVLPHIDAAVDAFLLDGFAPACNPAMWTPRVLRSLADLANAGATLATWCSTGAVRRRLIDAGFVVDQRPGFGGERDMTAAYWPHAPGPVAAAALSRVRPPGRAGVIGAGLAGTSAATALVRRGWQVTIHDGSLQRPASETGQAHPAAALGPVPDATDSPRARLLRLGAQRAQQLWQPWLGALDDDDAWVRRTGTFQVAGSRQARTPERLAAWQAGIAALQFPTSWVEPLSAREGAKRVGQAVGRDGVWLAGGLLVQPDALLCGWQQASAITRTGRTIAGWRASVGGGWVLLDATGAVCDAVDLLVLAAGPATASLWQASEPQVSVPGWVAAWHRVAGQVAWLPPARLAAGAPRAVVSGDSYVLPTTGGAVVLGSTYDHEVNWPDPAPFRAQHWPEQWRRMARLLPANEGCPAPRPAGGWAGWRAVLPDRLPVVDWLAPGLAVASGMGSRGLAWSGWLGDLLAGDVSGEPSLLTRDLRTRIGVTRFAPAAKA